MKVVNHTNDTASFRLPIIFIIIVVVVVYTGKCKSNTYVCLGITNPQHHRRINDGVRPSSVPHRASNEIKHWWGIPNLVSISVILPSIWSRR